MRKPIVRFHLERLLLLAFWVQKRCKIAISFHCCIYSEYTSHPPIFVHALEAEKLQIGPKVDCDWSILGSRFSLVESSAFPGCLANVAACLNSCFMHTNFHTNLRKTSPPHHYIIITPTWYQPFEATISAQVHHNYFPNYQPGGAFTFWQVPRIFPVQSTNLRNDISSNDLSLNFYVNH